MLVSRSAVHAVTLARSFKVSVGLLAGIGFLEAVIFGLSYPLYALSLKAQGYAEGLIGLNAALGGLGVFVIGPLAPWLIVRLGYKTYAAACFLLAGFAILALALDPGYLGWCLSRLVLGLALGSTWILTEAWLNEIVPDSKRGRANSFFQFCYSVGFMAGPGIAVVIGYQGTLPLMFLATVAVFALAATVALSEPEKGGERESGRLDISVAWQAKPFLLVAFVTGLVETALYTLLPIFGQKLGFGEQASLTLLLALSVGAISFALPLGWIMDKVDRSKVLLAVSGGACLSMLLLIAGVASFPLSWAANCLAGATIIGMYNVSLVILGERYSSAALRSVTAVYSMAYALGTTAGGALGGFAMEAQGPVGLPALGALAIGSYLAYLTWTTLSLNSRGGWRSADR